MIDPKLGGVFSTDSTLAFLRFIDATVLLDGQSIGGDQANSVRALRRAAPISVETLLMQYRGGTYNASTIRVIGNANASSRMAELRTVVPTPAPGRLTTMVTSPAA